MKYSDVWLVIPCFNEATVIRDVIANARKTFPNIVAVDDGSKDGSPEQILAGGAHLVQHPVNLGQGRRSKPAWNTRVHNPVHAFL